MRPFGSPFAIRFPPTRLHLRVGGGVRLGAGAWGWGVGAPPSPPPRCPSPVCSSQPDKHHAAERERRQTRPATALYIYTHSLSALSRGQIRDICGNGDSGQILPCPYYTFRQTARQTRGMRAPFLGGVVSPCIVGSSPGSGSHSGESDAAPSTPSRERNS